ncbi:small ribosomal subunit protein mS22-like [Amphiura filiformis]|uniref:small ribosomal subunit protein mS22-like n=1 Tax=Amphiura filiformis TaxID=82378 RepID=UPI003B2204C3
MATYMRNVFLVSSGVSSRSLHRLMGKRTFKELQYRVMCTLGTEEPRKLDIPQFNDPQVQAILKRITGLDLEKVFRPAREKHGRSSYKLVSEKKLKELQIEAQEKAKVRLEMPPVVAERKPIHKIFARNPELRGLDSSKLVFTDISFGLRDRDRLIVVRDPDGTLRMANWEERDRITQVYKPRPRRQIEVPKLFEEGQLPVLFSEERHEMVLDAACTQFEPDAADFIRVHHRVYEDLDQTTKYDLLRSTRHFGGMAYYLAKQRRIDGLLVDIIQRYLITDAEDLITLYHMMHPQCKSAQETKEKQLKGLELIKMYIQCDSSQTGKLELVLQSYENEQADSTTDEATSMS